MNWALTFVMIGFLVALFEFFGVTGMAKQIAWILFGAFMVLFLVSFISGRRRPASR